MTDEYHKEQLKMLFPHLTETSLANALRDADGDLELAATMLLSATEADKHNIPPQNPRGTNQNKKRKSIDDDDAENDEYKPPKKARTKLAPPKATKILDFNKDYEDEPEPQVKEPTKKINGAPRTKILPVQPPKQSKVQRKTEPTSVKIQTKQVRKSSDNTKVKCCVVCGSKIGQKEDVRVVNSSNLGAYQSVFSDLEMKTGCVCTTCFKDFEKASCVCCKANEVSYNLKTSDVHRFNRLLNTKVTTGGRLCKQCYSKFYRAKRQDVQNS
jgi:hypothetical protein